MRKVLFLIPSLAYGGAARQLCLLAAHLSRERFEPRVAVLGEESPWAAELRKAGVAVDVLGRRRPFDLLPYVNLRRAVRDFAPDVVHAWGPAGPRLARLAGVRGDRVVLSAALPAGRGPDWLGARLLRRAGRVLALGEAEAGRYRALGVAAGRLAVAAPAVEVPAPPAVPDPPDPALPAGRIALAVGPLLAPKGYRDAVWAADILGYLYDDLSLVLAGGGPDRGRLAAFARASGAGRRVRFVGELADLGPLRRRATQAWVPSRTGGGVNAALEAMAAGLPVIAGRVPELAEVVPDGEAGLFFPPGDRAALARQARALVEDPARARALGAAGRRRAAELFPPSRLVEAAAAVYQ